LIEATASRTVLEIAPVFEETIFSWQRGVEVMGLFKNYPDRPVIDGKARGWVYVIVNDLIESRVKIGYTGKDPIHRAENLRTTGTTGTFVVLYQAWVDGAYGVEQRVHEHLAFYRRDGEWFEISVDEAVTAIREVTGGAIHAEDSTARWPLSQSEPSESTKMRLTEARKAAEQRLAEQLEAERVAREFELQARQAERLKQEKAIEAQRIAEQFAREEEAEARRLDDLQKEAERRLAEERRRRDTAATAKRAAELRKLVVTIAGVAACLGVVGGVTWESTRPLTQQEVQQLRQVVEQRKKDIARLPNEIQAAQRELEETENEISALPERRGKLTALLARRERVVEDCKQAVVTSKQSLEDFDIEYPDLQSAAANTVTQRCVADVEDEVRRFLSSRPGAFDHEIAQVREQAEATAAQQRPAYYRNSVRLWQELHERYASAFESAVSNVAAAEQEKVLTARAISGLLQELSLANERIAFLKATVATKEKELSDAKKGLDAAKTDLGLATR